MILISKKIKKLSKDLTFIKEFLKFEKERLKEKWLNFFWPFELYGIKKWIERNCGKIYQDALLSFLKEKEKEAKKYWMNGGNMFDLIECKILQIRGKMDQTLQSINELLANTKPFER